MSQLRPREAAESRLYTREVNQHRARLVLGLVTIFGWVNHLGT